MNTLKHKVHQGVNWWWQSEYKQSFDAGTMGRGTGVGVEVYVPEIKANSSLNGNHRGPARDHH